MASSDWTLATRSVVLFQHDDNGQSIHAHNGTAHSVGVEADAEVNGAI
jgi:hypothetical protein